MDIRDLIFSIGIQYDETKEGKQDKQISYLERITNLNLPYDFKVFFNQIQESPLGPVLFEYHFDNDYIMRIANRIRFLIKIVESDERSIVGQYKKLQEMVREEYHPENMIPFGVTNDDSMLLLDYNECANGSDNPRVVMLGEEFTYIASSITDFFKKIIEQNYFRRATLLQLSRQMRVMDRMPDLFDFNCEYRAIRKITSHILSEEASAVLQHPDIYLGLGLEEGVSDMLKGTAAYPIPLNQISMEDIDWVERSAVLNPFLINNIEKSVDVKLPASYKKFVSKHNAISAVGGSVVPCTIKGTPGYLDVKFFNIMDQSVDNEWAVGREGLAKVIGITKDENLKNELMKMVPFASVYKKGSENYGVLCFYYKDGKDSEPLIVAHYMDDKESNYPWALIPIALNFEDFISAVGYELRITSMRTRQIVRALESKTMQEEIRSNLMVSLCYMLNKEMSEVEEVISEEGESLKYKSEKLIEGNFFDSVNNTRDYLISIE